MDFQGEVRSRRPQTSGFKLFDEEQPNMDEPDKEKPLFAPAPRQGMISSFFRKIFSVKGILIILALLFIGTLVAGFFMKDGNFLTRIFKRSSNSDQIAEQLVKQPATMEQVKVETVKPTSESTKPTKLKKKSKSQKRKRRDDDDEEYEEDDDEDEPKKPKSKPKKTTEDKKKENEQIRSEREELIKKQETQDKPVEPTPSQASGSFDHKKFDDTVKNLEIPQAKPEKKREPYVEKPIPLKEIEPKNFHLDTLTEKKNIFKYVVDDYKEGKVPKGVPLLYFSSNHDLNVPFKGHKDFLGYEEDLYKYIDNDNYIIPLVYYGYISKIIWVKHSNSFALPTGKYTVNVGNVEGTEQLAVDRKDILEFFASYSPKLVNVKTFVLEVIEFDEWYKNKPTSASYNDLLTVAGETEVKPPVLFVNLDFFDFLNPATDILRELKIDNIEPLVKWKSASNYCFETQQDSEKIYKFFNQMFKAERTLSKVKIAELAKPLIPLWCKGKEAGENYFKILDQLANKDRRLLTAITRADLPYHHHTEKEVEVMIKQFVAFLDEIYSVKSLVLTPGRPRRPYVSVLAMKNYHTKNLLSLIHKLVGELFHAPVGDYEIHDTDEKPPSQNPDKKLVNVKPASKNTAKVKSGGKRKRHARRNDDDDEDEDEDDEEDDRDRRNRSRRKRKAKKAYNYKDDAVRKRLDYLLEEVNKKPVLDNKGAAKVPTVNQRK